MPPSTQNGKKSGQGISPNHLLTGQRTLDKPLLRSLGCCAREETSGSCPRTDTLHSRPNFTEMPCFQPRSSAQPRSGALASLATPCSYVLPPKDPEFVLLSLPPTQLNLFSISRCLPDTKTRGTTGDVVNAVQPDAALSRQMHYVPILGHRMVNNTESLLLISSTANVRVE